MAGHATTVGATRNPSDRRGAEGRRSTRSRARPNGSATRCCAPSTVFERRGSTAPRPSRALFPRTVLTDPTYEDVVTSIISGAHLLFFGPSGAGKTSLAKELWNLFPKGVWVVEGCPVLDHPLSLIDRAAAARFPPCPICTRRFAAGGDAARFDPGAVDPAKIPAEFILLREGFGFARLQGSSEVFPDHLTGNINLRKLEEIGDPMSPLVLEPGKLLQANRGFLLVDEIGKLPLGTQNVLLQALQEGTVTPSKSRESFPGSFVAVCPLEPLRPRQHQRPALRPSHEPARRLQRPPCG